MPRILQAFGESFAPLRVHNLRVYLSGQAVSLMGTWMQSTAQQWVVWDLTRSTAALGIVAALGTLPLLLLGPFSGAWADRLDRRRVLVVTQSIAAVLAVVLGVLVQTHLVQLWHVYLLASLLGCVAALDMPSQQAFIGDLAGMEHVRKAVVLNAMINQVSRMVGPALAGWAIGWLGVAPAFWFNALSFAAVIASLLAVRATQVRKHSTGSSLGEFRDGLRFVRSQPRMQDLLIFTVFAAAFGIANMQIMPSFATQIFHRGPETLGLLIGCQAAGALTGALVVVPIAQRQRRIGLALAAAATWAGLCYLTVSFSTWLPLSLVALYGTGLGIPVIMTTANGLVQFLAPPNMRARLLSVWLMVGFGLQPISSLLVGYGAHFLGSPWAVRFNALCMLGGTALLLLARPELRTWEVHTAPVQTPMRAQSEVPASA